MTPADVTIAALDKSDAVAGAPGWLGADAGWRGAASAAAAAGRHHYQRNAECAALHGRPTAPLPAAPTTTRHLPPGTCPKLTPPHTHPHPLLSPLLQSSRSTSSSPSWAPRRATWRCAAWPRAASTSAAVSSLRHAALCGAGRPPWRACRGGAEREPPARSQGCGPAVPGGTRSVRLSAGPSAPNPPYRPQVIERVKAGGVLEAFLWRASRFHDKARALQGGLRAGARSAPCCALRVCGTERRFRLPAPNLPAPGAPTLPCPACPLPPLHPTGAQGHPSLRGPRGEGGPSGHTRVRHPPRAGRGHGAHHRHVSTRRGMCACAVCAQHGRATLQARPAPCAQHGRAAPERVAPPPAGLRLIPSCQLLCPAHQCSARHSR